MEEVGITFNFNHWDEWIILESERLRLLQIKSQTSGGCLIHEPQNPSTVVIHCGYPLWLSKNTYEVDLDEFFIRRKEVSYSNSYRSIRKGVSVENLEKIFNKYDSNGDGKISSNELASVLEALGSDSSQEELKRMMSEIDTDGDGFIDLKEFAAFHLATDKDTDGYNDLKDAFDLYDKDTDGYNDLKAAFDLFDEDTDGYNDLKAAFDVFDVDQDGLISAAELHLVFKNLGEKCTVGDCRKMIRSVDVDGDGCVNFEEFG